MLQLGSSTFTIGDKLWYSGRYTELNFGHVCSYIGVSSYYNDRYTVSGIHKEYGSMTFEVSKHEVRLATKAECILYAK